MSRKHRDFKLRDPFLTKIVPFLPNIFRNPKNIRYFEVLYGTKDGDDKVQAAAVTLLTFAFSHLASNNAP